MSWPWSELGLSGPSDLAAVRRAYAERLKTTHPEEDPEGFQRLHEAYQEARRLARKGGGSPAPQPTPPPAEGTEETFSAPEKPSGQPQESPPEGQPGWDFEQIFRQEAQRRAEERERQAAERRERFFAKYRPASQEEVRRLETRFARIEAALTVIEELSDSNAILQEWISFLYSGVFFSVKGDENFVAGLEDFLRRTPDLEESVKNELAQAFGLRKLSVPPVWFGLQDLLTGTDHSASPPEVLQKAPPKKKPLWKSWPVRIAAIFLLLLAGIPLAAHQIKEIRERPARALMCQYLEEDLGRRMESLQSGQNYENLYSPWDQPNLTFIAWPDGERNLAAGQRGYTTNYGNAMLTEALEDFVDQRPSWELKKLEEGGVRSIYGGTPGGYLIKVSLQGQDEGIEALGALMESLQAEQWYQVCQPEYTLQLGTRDLIYYTYTPDTPFDGAALLDYYQNEAGNNICIYLIEQSELARVDFGGKTYKLMGQEPVELDGSSYYLVSGIDSHTGETVRQYLYDGMYLVSFPAESFHLDLKSHQLHTGDEFQSSWENKPMLLCIIRK